MTDARTLELADAVIAYDVHHAGVESEHPILLMLGQPMTAEGFLALASAMDDRTVVTYDPRGLGRSTRSDGSAANDPAQQARDVHALIAELGGGPVDVFGSSGGAVTGLQLVLQHPDDVRVLVAHEPPLIPLLPDADAAARAARLAEETYQAEGFGAGLARFIAMISWEGEFTDAFFEQPAPDPAQFGLPTEDDGSRDDPLLSGASANVTALDPDPAALLAAPARIEVGIGETSGQVITGRASAVLAERLGIEPTIFRGGHGGFAADEWGVPGDPALFARQLRAALDS